MPSSLRCYGEWTLAKIRQEVSRIGPMLSLLVEKVIEAKPQPLRVPPNMRGFFRNGCHFIAVASYPVGPSPSSSSSACSVREATIVLRSEIGTSASICAIKS